jgi:hypothetical protein
MYRTINGRQTELNIRGVYRSLKKIYQINQGVKETRKSLREPEMIKNLDNAIQGFYLLLNDSISLRGLV